MATRLSDAFGVSSQRWKQEGAFDAFVDIDSRFHLDPRLLENCSAPEFVGAYDKFTAHFDVVIRLLNGSQRSGDRLYREAVQRLIFPEVPGVALGYSQGGIAGSGIGLILATRLTSTSAALVAAGLKDPAIFELAGLFEDGIGADRLSDMTIYIVLPNLLAFSQRIATELNLITREYSFGKDNYRLPFLRKRGKPIVLVPEDLLRTLPVALDWDDIDLVSAYNAALRDRVNRIVGSTWKKATNRVSKRQLRDAFLQNPKALEDLIAEYRKRPATPYDFVRDPDGEVIWHEIAREASQEFPLRLRDPSVTPDSIFRIVTTICNHFANLIEANGLFHSFYTDSRELRNERFAQLLFFGIADAYCTANNLDLSREPNAGRGPVDFKITHGYDARVNVEVKYSSNSRLVSGYESQLPIYDAAERTHHSIYLIIRTTESVAGIRRVQVLESAASREGRRAPKVIVVDGRYKRSASKN